MTGSVKRNCNQSYLTNHLSEQNNSWKDTNTYLYSAALSVCEIHVHVHALIRWGRYQEITVRSRTLCASCRCNGTAEMLHFLFVAAAMLPVKKWWDTIPSPKSDCVPQLDGTLFSLCACVRTCTCICMGSSSVGGFYPHWQWDGYCLVHKEVCLGTVAIASTLPIYRCLPQSLVCRTLTLRTSAPR